MITTIDLFNERWYLVHNPDVAYGVARGVLDAREHFLMYGSREGRAPGPLFDPVYYLASNPDVLQAISRGESSAYDHFMRFGMAEGRSPVALFDTAFYLAQNPDVAQAVEAGILSPVEHFLIFGQHEPRHINSSIDLTAYLAANADVDAAVQAGHMSALEHLLLFGVNEGRDLGNGIALAMFATDPAFQQALADGDTVAALLRVDTVAPFLPSFEPPPDWSPAPETPIVTDYTPPGGVKLVVPQGVIVPSGMVLPDTYEQPPAPDTGGDVPPTFTVAMEMGIVSFSGSATGDIVLTVLDDGSGSFTRGGVTASLVIPSVLSAEMQGSAATETFKLASALTGHSSPPEYETLRFNGIGGSDRVVLADGTNELKLVLQHVAEVKGGAGDDSIALLNQADGLVIDGAGGYNRLGLSYTAAHPNEASSVRVQNIQYVMGNAATSDSVTLLDTPTAFEFVGVSGGNSLTLADGPNNIALNLSNVMKVKGGAGDDVMSLVNSASGLTIDGGGGTDRVELALNGGPSYVQIRGVEQVQGGQSASTVELLDAPSAFGFTGGAGFDILILSDAGNSIALTLNNVEQLNGGAGNDVITIVGGSGGLTINGNAGNDQITAGAGSDIINGGEGSDIIDGGEGNDTFVYASASDSHIVSEALPASGFDVVTVTEGDIFDFNIEVVSVRALEAYVDQVPAVNGDALLAQLNEVFRSVKSLSGDAVSSDGVDAMFISIGNNDKGRFLVVDIDADDHLTANDVIIELAGDVATLGYVALELVGGDITIGKYIPVPG